MKKAELEEFFKPEAVALEEVFAAIATLPRATTHRSTNLFGKITGSDPLTVA